MQSITIKRLLPEGNNIECGCVTKKDCYRFNNEAPAAAVPSRTEEKDDSHCGGEDKEGRKPVHMSVSASV